MVKVGNAKGVWRKRLAIDHDTACYGGNGSNGGSGGNGGLGGNGWR